jgi:hypothetical protein
LVIINPRRKTIMEKGEISEMEDKSNRENQ